MTGKLKWLFERGERKAEPEHLGEDMVPSPLALAERSALTVADSGRPASNKSPFSSVAAEPVRDFTG